MWVLETVIGVVRVVIIWNIPCLFGTAKHSFQQRNGLNLLLPDWNCRVLRGRFHQGGD
jgi:hypothetical protein